MTKNITLQQIFDINVFFNKRDKIAFKQIRMHKIILILYNIANNLIQSHYLVVAKCDINCIFNYETLSFIFYFQRILFWIVVPVAYLVEYWVPVIDIFDVLIPQKCFDAPAIKTQNCYHVGHIQFQKAFEKYLRVWQLGNQFGHFILRRATEDTLEEKNLP